MESLVEVFVISRVVIIRECSRTGVGPQVPDW